jgi:hypothetical protein
MMLAQKPETIAVIDLFCNQVAPALDREAETCDVILKCTVTANISFEQQIAAFRPDRLVLVTRNIEAIRASLSRKPWANAGGGLDRKCAIYTDVLLRRIHHFDEVISYERLCSVNTPLTRSCAQILAHNQSHSIWCRDSFGSRWGFGAFAAEGGGSPEGGP